MLIFIFTLALAFAVSFATAVYQQKLNEYHMMVEKEYEDNLYFDEIRDQINAKEDEAYDLMLDQEYEDNLYFDEIRDQMSEEELSEWEIDWGK